MKRFFWTSSESLLASVIVGMILGHLASLGDIALHPPFGTVLALAVALLLYAAVKAVRARRDRARNEAAPSCDLTVENDPMKQAPLQGESGRLTGRTVRSLGNSAAATAASEGTREAETSESGSKAGVPEISAAAAVDLLAQQCSLSAREREVLELLADGLSAADIQDHLVISMNTVKTHMRHVYAKLGVHSSVELHDKIAATRKNAAAR